MKEVIKCSHEIGALNLGIPDPERYTLYDDNSPIDRRVHEIVGDYMKAAEETNLLTQVRLMKASQRKLNERNSKIADLEYALEQSEDRLKESLEKIEYIARGSDNDECREICLLIKFLKEIQR